MIEYRALFARKLNYKPEPKAISLGSSSIYHPVSLFSIYLARSHHNFGKLFPLYLRVIMGEMNLLLPPNRWLIFSQK